MKISYIGIVLILILVFGLEHSIYSFKPHEEANNYIKGYIMQN